MVLIGGAYKSALMLSERTWRCHVYSLGMDRDLNAARNIAAFTARSSPANNRTRRHGKTVNLDPNSPGSVKSRLSLRLPYNGSFVKASAGLEERRNRLLRPTIPSGVIVAKGSRLCPRHHPQQTSIFPACPSRASGGFENLPSRVWDA